MKKQGPAGIIAPVLTPFDKSENIDEAIVRREIRYLIDCGVHGISPGGSTGEGAVLTDDELVRMVEICQEENTKGLPVVAGVIRTSTRAAVKAGIAAKKAGATALMVTPTFYNVLVPDDDGNYDFYKRIAGETGLPVIIYNVVHPQNEIKPNLFARLCEIEGVIGIKQSAGGIQGFYDMMMACGDKGLIYSATDDMLYSTLDLGAYGAIAAILTVFPKQCVQIWDAVQAGDRGTSKALQDKIYPMWQVLKGPQFPRRIKEALRQMGRETGICRSPNLDATAQEKLAIKAMVKRLG
jgi:Dihydrodipicolinate synthase/N-acetylneuraminate lyase